MKDIINKVKINLPKIKKYLFNSLPILLIYQAILFLLDHTIVNTIFLFVLVITYVIITLTKKV